MKRRLAYRSGLGFGMMMMMMMVIMMMMMMMMVPMLVTVVGIAMDVTFVP